MQEKEYSLRSLSLVYLGLMLFLALTVGASFLPLGRWSAPVSLLIALGKAFLVTYFFMKLGQASAGLRVVAFAGVFWLMLLMGITFGDYFTRFSFGVLGK